jgi:uncharacterized protein (TIGR00369 family)
VTREGPFWDVMEGRTAPPPAAELLGWELVAVDPEAGTIEVAFTATERFLNPIGVIQGGLLAAMLDDTLGPALVATLGPGQFAPTADLHVQFLRPARPGRLTGRGRVVHQGKGIAFLAGELLDDSGQIVAVATATAKIRLSKEFLHLAEPRVLRVTQPLEQHHLRGHDLRAVLPGPVDRRGPVGRVARADRVRDHQHLPPRAV